MRAPWAGLAAALALTACAAAGARPRIWPASPPPAPTVDVVDVAGQTPSLRLALTMLQGLANRGRQARVYVTHPGPADAFWMEQLRARGYVRATAPLSVDGFLAKYAASYRRVFVYDPALTGSINAAVMLGALEDGLACAPEDARRLAAGRPTVDLRGRWPNSAAAIAWARRTLSPRLNRRMLASMNPQAGEISLYDYIVAHRVFTFWITGEAKGSAAHRAERAEVEQVLRAAPANIPVIGFWFTGADPGINEYTGVGLAGETGQYTLVTSLCGNLSLLAGVRVDWPAAVRRYAARLAQRPGPELQPDRIYVCFEFTESGDSPFYLQHVQWKQWQDPNRGAIPFNWNVGPAIIDLAPSIMEYFYDAATPRDFFFVSLSGAGYNHPYRSLFGRLADPEPAWREYVAQTRDYMRRMGLRDLQLYTDSWRPFDRAKMDPVTLRFVRGIPGLRSMALGMGRDEGRNGDNGTYTLDPGGVVVAHCLTRWDPAFDSRTREQNIDWLVKDIQAHAPSSRPGFMHVMALSWAYGPSDHAEIARRLGPEYVPVTLAEYARLYRRAHPAPAPPP